MGKKTRGRYLSVLDPGTVANMVINLYITNARQNLSVWASNYQEGINRYLNDVQKQGIAKQKLADWYSALVPHIPEIQRVFAAIRAERVTRKGVRVVPTTALPPPPA